jgi:hypothetical protein
MESPEVLRGRSSSKSTPEKHTSTNLESFKFISDGERKSYVEYLNKHLSLPIPIDIDSPTDLFEVVSQGVILP